MRSLLLIIPLAASGAQADQWINTYNMRSFNNVGAAGADVLMSQMIINSRLQDRMMSAAKARGEAANQSGPAPPQPKYQFALSATDFNPAGTRNMPEQLAATASTPSDRAQVADLCRRVQQAIEANPDVRKNNLATAVTILLGSSIQVVAQRKIGDAEGEDLLRVVNDAIAGTPDFEKMTNEQRTAAYDMFLITGGLVASVDASAKETNDPALAALARELAVNSLARFGFKASATGPSPQPVPASTPVVAAVHEATPAATQQSNSREMLDGIYTGLAKGLVYAPGTVSFMNSLGDVDIGVSKVYVTFYPDGKVYRRVPEGGLEGWDRESSEAEVPDLWGRYNPVGLGRWEIDWNYTDQAHFVVREGDGLRYEDGMVFPVATCEGLVLDGVYAQPGWEQFQDPYSIAFNAAGQFADDRLVGSIAYQGYSVNGKSTIGPGVGRYRTGRNTLYLEYDDGRRVPVEMHVRLADIKRQPIPVIFINGWELVRVPR